jgi:proline iminopeptidase
MIFMIRRSTGRLALAPVPSHATADTMRTVLSTTSLLHADTAPLRTHEMRVGNGHVLHVQEHGRHDGIAAVVLHGGPGSGCTPLQRRFFDPARYRIVCIDQRGAGLSRPRGETAHNTTDDLLEDLRQVREALQIERWLAVGGSWGATLAVAHAADEPEAVAALLLRSSFLARAEDIAWFFGGAAALLPQPWRSLKDAVPDGPVLPGLAHELARDEPEPRRAAALAWARWEQALATGAQDDATPSPDVLDALVDRYRVQGHYLLHGCWLGAPTLLERCEAVPPVPTLMLHGTADRVCRSEGALALHRALPHSQLQWVDGVGHDPTHPAMAGAMVAALDAYARHGRFTP